ncbi:MAG: ABC transporter substrate-binding protein [Anaerolineae bacterium]
MNVKWVIRVILLVLLASNVAACRCAVPSAPGAAADLSAERTRVQCRHPGQAVEDVAVGDHEPVTTGDQISTDQAGLGILTFADFLRVEVFRKTGLQVKAAPDPNAPPIVKLYLALGTTLQGLQRQAGQRVDVTTDTDWATIRAVATTYLIAVDDDEVTWVVLFDGEAEVEAQRQTVVVRAGQATWVEPGQPPHTPIDVDPGVIEGWVNGLRESREVGPIRPVIVPPEPEAEDRTEPWLEVWHSPSEPNEGQAVIVVAEAGDDGSGLDRIEIQIPGQPLLTCRESPCQATGGPYPAGEFGYEVWAFDGAGNVAHREGHFGVAAAFVQDYPPVVEEIYVEPTTIYQRGMFRLKVSASDDTGLQSIRWWSEGTGDDGLDRGDEASCGGITWCEPNWLGLKWIGRDGQFTIYAQARDTADQLSSIGSTTITVLPPGVAARFSLSIGGGPFNNKSVQEAVGFAINWAALRDEIGEVVLVDFLSGETLAGPTEPAYNPDRAKALLEEVGYYSFDTALLFDPGDELANKLAEAVASYLKVIIGSEFIGVAPADARAKLATIIEAGESGMLIERR